jgi:hypothetical protein
MLGVVVNKEHMQSWLDFFSWPLSKPEKTIMPAARAALVSLADG